MRFSGEELTRAAYPTLKVLPSTLSGIWGSKKLLNCERWIVNRIFRWIARRQVG